jgi:hypothetical protein
MKITKNQLRRIIREEKQRLLNEITPAQAGSEAVRMDGQMSARTADAVQLLQTVYYNLDDLVGGLEGDSVVDDVLMNMELIKDAIHSLGAVLP